MPPPGYEPFLRAICESPEDDTVRLVYADWLDENGDAERAEFIRWQIQFALAGNRGDIHPDLHARYLLACQHWERWKDELPKLPGINWPGSFRRGFPYQVDTSDGRWLVRHRAAIFSAIPVEEVSVTNAGLGTLTQILQLAELVRVSTLWLLNCRLVPGQWSVVSACPYLGRLTRLVVSPSSQRSGQPVIEFADARVLAGSPFLPRQLELRLDGWIAHETFGVLRTRFANVISYRLSSNPPPGTPPL